MAKNKNTIMLVRNKKGWIKIIEAFISILLVAGIVIIVAGGDNFRRDDFSLRAHDAQVSILREIQLDDSLRAEILETNGEIEWDDIGFPPEVKDKINEKPVWLDECVAKLCPPANLCVLTDEQMLEIEEKNIFSEHVIISSNLVDYNPRKLKMFCWD